jgi:hypothetical protein
MGIIHSNISLPSFGCCQSNDEHVTEGITPDECDEMETTAAQTSANSSLGAVEQKEYEAKQRKYEEDLKKYQADLRDSEKANAARAAEENRIADEIQHKIANGTAQQQFRHKQMTANGQFPLGHPTKNNPQISPPDYVSPLFGVSFAQATAASDPAGSKRAALD